MIEESWVNILAVVHGTIGHQIVYHYPDCSSKEKIQKGNETKETEKILNLDPNALASMLCPSNSLNLNRPLILKIDEILLLSQQCGITEKDSKLTHVSIVFAFRKGVKDEKIDEYLNLLSIFVKILQREQKRCKFLTRELEESLKFREKYPEWDDYIKFVNRKIELMKEFKQLTDTIVKETPLQLRINNWIEFDVKIPTTKNEFTMNSNVQPYDSCVGLKEFPKLKFPIDGIDQVEMLRGWINPMKSLQEISRRENLSLNLVCSIAQHMIQWGVIRSLPKLTSNSILIVSEEVVFPIEDKYILEFHKNFPLLPSLLDVLSYFNESKKMQDHFDTFKFEDKKQQFVKSVCWLLRYNFVRQVSRFIQFIVPYNPSIDLRSPNLLEMRNVYEFDFLNAMTSDEDLLDLLKRLIPYFDGNHEIREIIWRENLEFDDIEKIISTFKDCLVVYQI